MKILWFSNRPVINNSIKESGSWLSSMALELMNNRSIELYVISERSGLGEIEYSSLHNIQQFLVPHYKIKSNGLPAFSNISQICSIVNEVEPDLIHVWGVENYWGLLFSRGYIKHPFLLLDMQGVLEACRDNYKGNINFGDIVHVLPLVKALYSYCYIYIQQYRMHKRVKYENEIISYFPNIGFQSLWVKEWLRYKTDKANLYNSLISIRKEFKDEPFWTYNCNQNKILLITSAQCYKRIDIAIKALSILNKTIHADLIIIGVTLNRRRGYDLYIDGLIRYLGIEKQVIFEGNKTASEIKSIALQCRCAVIPSAVESYSLALDECRMLGIPAVVSYSGALPELGSNSSKITYFPSGDYVSCASEIRAYFENEEQIFGIQNKKNGARISPVLPADRQLEIYNHILNKR